MQKSIHPLAAAGILVFFGGLMLGWFWSNQQLLGLDRLLSIKLTPERQMAVQLGEQLYFTDLDGQNLGRVDLADLGLERFVGDYAFFSDGDLLVSLSRESLALRDMLDVGLHNPGAERRDGDARLHRCSLEPRRCREFSTQLPDFYRSFRLYIHPDTQRVFIADTSRHQLWLLSADGELLAKKEGFKFPNQLLVHQSELWLADTNHHEIKRLVANPEQFGEVREAQEVRLGRKHIWPFALTLVAEDWWVLLADQGMKNARLVIYTDDWNQSRNLALPNKSDPQALLSLPDRVLVADYGLFRIHQFDLEGNPLPDFVPQALAVPLANLQRRAQFWQQTGHALIGLFVLALAVGFAFGIRQQLADRAEQAAQPALKPSSYSQLPPQGVWLEPSASVRLFSVMMGLCLGALVLILVFMGWRFAWDLKILACIAGLVFTLPPVFMQLKKIQGYRLGIFDDRLELMFNGNQKASASYDQIPWTPHLLCIDRHFIPLGSGQQMGIFPFAQLKQHVLPRLQPNRQISQWVLMRMQWQYASASAKAISLIALVAGIGLAGFILWLP